jgi:Flp pilus assembly protein CpaB
VLLSRWSRRLNGWPRRLAALVCLLLAATSVVSSRRASATETVVVTSRALAAGALITTADVTLARWPPGNRPAAAITRTAAAVGHRVAGPVGAGEALVASRLVSPALTTGLTEGFAAVPVLLADSGAASLVRSGDFADLLVPGVDGQAPVVIARRVLVLSVLPAASTAANTTAGTPPAELVVAVDEAGELALARYLGRAVFASVRTPP